MRKEKKGRGRSNVIWLFLSRFLFGRTGHASDAHTLSFFLCSVFIWVHLCSSVVAVPSLWLSGKQEFYNLS